jgi:hypothetical protein
MQAFLIVKGEVVAQIAYRFRNTLIVFEIHLLIFNAAPEALNEDIIQRASTAIPTDADVACQQALREFGTGELHALVTIEDLRRGNAQRPSCRCSQALGPPSWLACPLL